VLYLGCNVLRTSHMIRTVTAIFDRLGLDYVAVGGPTYCCGIVHHRNGDTAASGGMNKRTVELFQRYKPEEVVMWCPSCMFFYDEIQKFPWPFPVRHTTEFLADRLPSINFTHRVDQTVALHYHSQSAPRLREGAAGRRLLEAVPGLRVVDVGSEPRLGRLCTADVQAQLGQDVWDALIRDEIARARAGGAETLATIYHGCQRLMCGFETARPITIEFAQNVIASSSVIRTGSGTRSSRTSTLAASNAAGQMIARRWSSGQNARSRWYIPGCTMRTPVTPTCSSTARCLSASSSVRGP